MESDSENGMGNEKAAAPLRRGRRKAIIFVTAIGGLACLLGLLGVGFLAAAYAASGPTPAQLEATAYAKLTATAAGRAGPGGRERLAERGDRAVLAGFIGARIGNFAATL